MCANVPAALFTDDEAVAAARVVCGEHPAVEVWNWRGGWNASLRPLTPVLACREPRTCNEP